MYFKVPSNSAAILPILFIFLSNEITGSALHLPYGAIPKPLYPISDRSTQNQHPFFTRFLDRSPPENPGGLKGQLINQLKRKGPRLENPKRSKFHPMSFSQKRRPLDIEKELEEGLNERERLLAMEDIAELDSMLEEELNYAQQASHNSRSSLPLASGIIVDLKTILNEAKNNEGDFIDGNSELASRIEKAIDVEGQERLLRLS